MSSWAPPYKMGTIWSTQVASPVQVGPAIRQRYPSRSRTIFLIFFHGAETYSLFGLRFTVSRLSLSNG